MKDLSAVSNKWFFIPKKNKQANLRLFCFPFGGGGASFYRSWSEYLPPNIELYSVQLPGRENRLKEEPFTRLMPLVTTLSGVIEPYLDIPFVFFGHSMGSWISFELTRHLLRQSKPGPAHLFVSGRRAPQLQDPDPPKHNLPESELIKELRRYNGTPELVLQEPELLDIFMPIIRADLAVLETYKYIEELPIECPITAFGGLEDRKTGYEKLIAWRENTIGGFRLKMFPGDHFYLKETQGQLLGEMIKDLKSYL